MDEQLQALFDFSMYIAAFLALFVGSGLLVYALALLWESYLSLIEWMNERSRARRRRRMGIYPQPKRRSR